MNIDVLLADANGQAVPPVRDDIKSFTAYIFEVDLEYPNAIHDRDDDYPLAPEVMQIKTGMLSEKQMRLRRLLRRQRSVKLQAHMLTVAQKALLAKRSNSTSNAK